MRKIFTIPVMASLCLVIATSSCKKKEDTPTPAAPTTTTPTTSGATAPTPATGSVDGVLVSLMLDVNTVTAGYTVKVKTENALASFFTSTGSSTLVDGGTVTVNSYTLEKQSGNSYFRTATTGLTPSDLGFDGSTCKWVIGGAGSVPSFTYDHSVSFPKFTGTVPESVTRNSGLTVSLSGKVSSADSVILFIAKDSKSITRTFAGSAASATISAADLASLPVVTDKSAILEIVPYRVTTRAEGGKTYAFIKEYAAVRYVNID